MSSEPILNDKLRELAAQSDKPFVRDSEKMIKYLLQVEPTLPMRYGWRVIAPEDFRKQLKSLSSPKEVNRLYWTYMARNIEAYDVILIWRSMGLLKTALHSLNAGEIVSSAVLSRSILELAVTGIINSNMIYDAVQKVIEVLKTHDHRVLVVSKELEDFIARMLFGTRMGEPPEPFKQRNILTYMQHLLDNLKKNNPENPAVTELMPVYENLCEFTHPNLLGNIRFWAGIETKSEDGSEIWRIERKAESELTSLFQEDILWALGWSAVCIRNAFEIGQNAVLMLTQLFRENI
jgi:hypothetical protein